MGGVIIEPIIWAKSPVHISIPILIGAGGAAYINNYYGRHTGHDLDYHYTEEADAFFVIEPGIEVELNMVNFMRLAVGGYYRYTSDLYLASTNMLQENISYDRIFHISKTVNYTYNQSSENYRISVFNDLSSSFNVFEGGFTDTTFVFDDTKIIFGDTINEGSEHIQYSISNIEKDSFIIERKSSMDKGETWNPKDKFTYTRKEE